MKTDRTTKALLAVIAISLGVIAAKDLGLVAGADAAGARAEVAVTNFTTSRNHFGETLFVRCTNCR
jgi:mRNA-degrading endonuclease toxin of MazEF toxin-antitoxin module